MGCDEGLIFEMETIGDCYGERSDLDEDERLFGERGGRDLISDAAS